MAANLRFDDEGARLVEAINVTPGVIARRRAILEALDLKPGEHVLEVGCGPGHLAEEMAAVVGPMGQVTGVDVSDEMIARARARCADRACAAFHNGDATDLPFPDAHFDAVVTSQVLEYLQDVPAALSEMRRVVRPGGRVIVHDTDWDSIVWHSSDRARMRRILDAWDGHLADPHLPQRLNAELRRAGLTPENHALVAQFDPVFGPHTFSHCLMAFITSYVVGQAGFSPDEVEAWAEDLRILGAEGSYFFSLDSFIFRARRPAEGA